MYRLASEKSDEQLRAPRPKWHLIYFALAAFDLLTISVSLYLNHRLVDIHSESVQVNQELAIFQRQYSKLGLRASEFNITGNNVFESGELEKEAGEKRVALRKFERIYAKAVDDLSQNLPKAESRPMLQTLKKVRARMAEQRLESDQIFVELAQKFPDKTAAGASMARMDRANAELSSALMRLRRQVLDLQESHLETQAETANDLRRIEYVIAGAILLMIAGVTIYGYQLSKHVRDNALANDRHVDALSESNEKIQAILDSADDGILTVDERGIIQSINRAAERIFQYDANDIVGESISQLLLPPSSDDSDFLNRGIGRAAKSGGIKRGIDVTAVRQDGTTLPMRLVTRRVRATNRQLFTVIATDITQRVSYERRLRFLARKQAAIATLGQQALESTNLTALLDRATQLVCTALNVEFSAVLEFLPGDDTLLLRAGAGWSDGVAGTATVDCRADSGAGFETLTRRTRGIVDYNMLVARDLPLFRTHCIQNGVHVVIRGHDRPYGLLGVYTSHDEAFNIETSHFLQALANVITTAIQREWSEQNKRELDIARAEQMTVVAQVATGVAHEMRNPLTSIGMLVAQNREEIETRGLPVNDLRIIEEEIDRMGRSLEKFLSYARPSDPVTEPHDIDTLCGKTLKLIAVQAKDMGVEINYKSTESPVQVKVDGGLIQQILLNLTLNSLQAMPNGGKLIVEAGSCDDTLAEVRITDTGPGISSHITERLFEPFVTTKEAGIGLGLVISRRIAEDHGGSLVVEHTSESGACFVLRLPRSRKPVFTQEILDEV